MRIVNLVPGNSCTIRCNGKLRVKLYTGNGEIAGAPLEPKKVITLFMEYERPLTLYTLEGCLFGLQPECEGDSRLSTEVGQLAMNALLRQVKKGFELPAPSANGGSATAGSGGLRIVVAGAKGSGRYLAACTIANSLNRTRGGDGVIFCDLTTSIDGQLSRLGTLGCIETHPEVPLWEGMQWSMYSASVMFFHGLSTPTVDASHLPQFLISASSACESAAWMSHQKKDAPIVYVLPSFDETSISKEMFFRAVLEPIKPTHVIFTADDDGNTQQTLTRLLPSAKLAYCGAVAHALSRDGGEDGRCPASSSLACCEAAVVDYFLGNELNPLGSTLMTLPLSSVQFVSLVSQHGGSVEAKVLAQGSGDGDDAGELDLASLRGLICTVSHGGSLQEIPYANVAGHVVISNVFPESNELEVISPSSDAFAPSPFFIIPDDRAVFKAPISRLLPDL